MEPNDNQLTSYFHHHHLQNPISTTAPSPTNGLLPPGDSTSGAHLMYPHPSAVPTTNAITTSTTTATNTNTTAAAAATTSSSPLEGKRKRGRPRKYGTPEQALAAKKAAAAANAAATQTQQQQTTSSHSTSSSKERKDLTISSSSKKSNLLAPGMENLNLISRFFEGFLANYVLLHVVWFWEGLK